MEEEGAEALITDPPPAGDVGEPDAGTPEEFPFMPSCVVLGVVALVDAIEYGCVMPSLSKYLEDIQGSSSTATYGAVLAVFSATSLCTKPLIGSWCDKRGFREVYLVTIVIAIIGSMVYALAGHWSSVPMVFVGRMLGGVGAANTSLQYAYVSRTVPEAKLSRIMMFAGMCFPIGMVLGPCMNLITAAADFTVLGVDVADTNGPGLLMALILATLLLVVMAVLREPLDYKQASASKQQELVKEVLKEICRPAVATCFLVIFAFNMYIAASEAVVVPVTQHATKLHFSPLQNSFVYAGLSSWMLVLSILIMLFGKRLSDRGLLLFAGVFYGAAVVACIFLWDYNMTLWHFLLGETLLISAIPFAFSPNRALFSKLVKGSVHQGLLSSLLSVVASLGAIAGPLFMGLTAGSEEESGPVAHAMFFGLLGLDTVIVVTMLVVWFGIDPPSKAKCSPEDVNFEEANKLECDDSNELCPVSDENPQEDIKAS